jgi:hypothetical protein
VQWASSPAVGIGRQPAGHRSSTGCILANQPSLSIVVISLEINSPWNLQNAQSRCCCRNFGGRAAAKRARNSPVRESAISRRAPLFLGPLRPPYKARSHVSKQLSPLPWSHLGCIPMTSDRWLIYYNFRFVRLPNQFSRILLINKINAMRNLLSKYQEMFTSFFDSLSWDRIK